MIVLPHKKIKDLLVLEPTIFHDFRGENCETYNKEENTKLLNDNSINGVEFIIDSFSFSRKNTLRGFHGDQHTWKLIQCLQGTIYLVVIDVRTNSSTYNRHESFNLNDKNKLQILIPPGCVNAHLCMSDECIFHYKLSSNYTKQEDQISIKWNDPSYGIYWPITNPILSNRDSSMLLERHVATSIQ